MPMAVPISTREPKRTVNQSVATPFRRTVASESTNQKPRSTIRKLYEHVSKTCSWWYPKFTPSGYKWKPKSPIGNVNTNVSMPLGNESRTADILEPMTPRCSTLSNTPLSSNSFAARTELLNKTLHEYFAQEGIEKQTSVAQTPKQNDVVKRWNRTLVEAARTMLSVAKVSLYFWAEAITSFFLIFGSLYYIVRDGENLDKMKEKDHVSSDPDLLFSLMFDELLNGITQVVSKSSTITAVDAPNQRQQQHTTPSTLTTVAVDTPPLNIQTTPETTS
ncbi:retrovirus-related pol polyprotein from transposon TNT 1-94 [Tanacetum coccineum]